jgi:hypothetical protein
MVRRIQPVATRSDLCAVLRYSSGDAGSSQAQPGVTTISASETATRYKNKFVIDTYMPLLVLQLEM